MTDQSGGGGGGPDDQHEVEGGRGGGERVKGEGRSDGCEGGGGG